MNCLAQISPAVVLAFCICLIACAGNSSAQEELEGQEEQAILAAVSKIAPSVVKIETLGGLERVEDVLVGTGPTTGLIVTDDGYVLSSAFNFAQQPTSILVTLPDGKRSAAQIVARDHARMLVLLKVKAESKLPVPEAAPREEMAVGQWSIAVGRTYDQPQPNVSVGVLSALNRVWGKAIQTDAKISPANYGGPLIDIHGRVLGILVPLAPQSHEESAVAGAEWYDSGIGFAIPLAEINTRLETLRAGKDLHPGLMGISLKPGDIYANAAEIAASQPGSPAYKAGLKAGDVIVELEGKEIVRQAQLKQLLGAQYAGDKVRLVAKRGSERVEVTLELAEKLNPYEHPFLGILPLRGSAAKGVRVRHVYPGSPAAEAGIKADDTILKLGDKEVADAAELRNLIANLEPRSKAPLTIKRGDEELTFEPALATLPTDIPSELPPAGAVDFQPKGDRPAVGLIEVKLPEEDKNECVAFIPDSYQPGMPHGLVIALHTPGKIDRDAFTSRWKDLCERHQLIVLAPQSAGAEKWEPTEVAFIRKTIDEIAGRYTIDPTRIVTFGYQTGGAMAWLVGFGNVDRVRGIATVDAGPPARAKAPENDPINRLALFIASGEKSASAPAIKRIVARLEADKFPVTKKSLGDQARELSADELAELVRWIDALDRI